MKDYNGLVVSKTGYLILITIELVLNLFYVWFMFLLASIEANIYQMVGLVIINKIFSILYIEYLKNKYKDEQK